LSGHAAEHQSWSDGQKLPSLQLEGCRPRHPRTSLPKHLQLTTPQYVQDAPGLINDWVRSVVDCPVINPPFCPEGPGLFYSLVLPVLAYYAMGVRDMAARTALDSRSAVAALKPSDYDSPAVTIKQRILILAVELVSFSIGDAGSAPRIWSSLLEQWADNHLGARLDLTRAAPVTDLAELAREYGGTAGLARELGVTERTTRRYLAVGQPGASVRERAAALGRTTGRRRYLAEFMATMPT